MVVHPLHHITIKSIIISTYEAWTLQTRRHVMSITCQTHVRLSCRIVSVSACRCPCNI